MAVITISREYGSRGEEIAQRVADKLGYSYFDKELLADVADIAHTTEDKIARFDEKDEHGLRRFLKQLFLPEYPSFGHYPYYPGMSTETARELMAEVAAPDADEVLNFTRQVVEKVWKRGNVVIVGRGGQKILAAKPDTLHISCIGSITVRSKAVMEREGVTYSEALKKIETSDKQRFYYLKHHYDADWKDPRLYHLTLNTGLMSVEQAVVVILTALRGLNETEKSQS